jgi:hypothetical protein
MSGSQQFEPEASVGFTVEPGKMASIVSMLASSPFLFALTLLFLIALAIPIKIFSPKIKFFR